MRPRRRRLLGWAVTWLVLAVACWITLGVQHAGGWQQTGVFSAGLAAAVVAWLRHLAGKLRRRLR